MVERSSNACRGKNKLPAGRADCQSVTDQVDRWQGQSVSTGFPGWDDRLTATGTWVCRTICPGVMLDRQTSPPSGSPERKPAQPLAECAALAIIIGARASLSSELLWVAVKRCRFDDLRSIRYSKKQRVVPRAIATRADTWKNNSR